MYVFVESRIAQTTRTPNHSKSVFSFVMIYCDDVNGRYGKQGGIMSFENGKERPSIEDRERETKKKYPRLKDLKLAVLKGEYNNEVDYYSRGFLWKSVCLNSYAIEFKEDELQSVPGKEDNQLGSHHHKQQLVKKSVLTDPLNGTNHNDDILEVIQLDVKRLIIDPLFQDEGVQNDIVQILYNYDKFNPYKQGFHEICGMVYLELYNDNPDNKRIRIETFNIFTSLMLSVVPNFYLEDNLIGWCISQFNKYLALIDTSLYELLVQRHKIESQVWLIRWVRLLFMRELGITNTANLIDFMICYDHDLTVLMPFIIIIFLIKIKIRLVECEDNGEILTLLLHYPSMELSHGEVKELIDLSIKLYRAPEVELDKYGVALNKKFSKGFKWDQLKDLDRLRMELKLQRRVKKALKK